MSAVLYPGIAFSPQAILTDNVGEAETIIKVSDVSAFPEAPNLATIGTDEEGETILYTAKTASSLSGCQRGVEGTARAWTAGEVIGRNFTAKDHASLIDAIKDAVQKMGEIKEQLLEDLSKKQNAFTGNPGQVIGFDGDGNPVPQSTDQLKGPPGKDGSSAYESATVGGYTGTEAEFTALLGSGPWLPLAGGTVTGPLSVQAPSADGHAATKKYVDDMVGDIAYMLDSINGEVV